MNHLQTLREEIKKDQLSTRMDSPLWRLQELLLEISFAPTPGPATKPSELYTATLAAAVGSPQVILLRYLSEVTLDYFNSLPATSRPTAYTEIDGSSLKLTFTWPGDSGSIEAGSPGVAVPDESIAHVVGGDKATPPTGSESGGGERCEDCAEKYARGYGWRHQSGAHYWATEEDATKIAAWRPPVPTPAVSATDEGDR